ncbi:hypothetical protein F373_gp050 [Bacillus phage SP-10]|uniref:hypothetical protein n=1 Tax=Bacillus phage SP10 TaxID=941058 RepID=UPI0002198B06|nr:hypothetical protein F373_gp050 [Bacillus phage SP-10]BAK52862.1 hypothetical protein [Bacillus phage SP-10]
MEYKGSYGKTVRVTVEKDLDGKTVNNELPHVVTFYIDSDDEIVGIYPLVPNGLSKDELLSVQPYKHEVCTHDLELVE